MKKNIQESILGLILVLSIGLGLFLIQTVTGEVAESATKGVSVNGGNIALPLDKLLVKGSDHASITIIAYTTFSCPPCVRAAQVIEQLMRRYPDEIQIVFKHLPPPTKPDTFLAHEASLAAAEQGKFWPMQDKLMSHRGSFSNKVFNRYALELGMDMESFSQTLEEHRFREFIFHEMEEARGYGVTGVPTFFINGRKLMGARALGDFRRVIDEELGITQRVQAPTSQPPAPSSQIALSDLDLSTAPVRGSAEAPIMIVEYSDFECPFCGRVVPTMEKILEEYSGKVKLVFKNFPLPIHPNAPLAHEAALAAGEQGKFWEMHDVIFANQRKMKRDDLLRYARNLGLKMLKFEKDLDSDKFKPLITKDLQEGQKLGVRGTPTFFINGRRVVGALPFETFKTIIDEELKKALKG